MVPRSPRPRFRARLGRIVAALTVAAWAFAAQGADGFVSGIDDLPLMAGLEETPEGSVVFDTAGGRIVEVYASGTVAKARVLAFYAETLPQLGWKPLGPASFRREGEVLRLDFSEAAGVLTVHFWLAPR